MVEIRENEVAYLLAYTREAEPDAYPRGLASSLHLACSRDGEYFTPLHENYGILFASGEISAKDTIVPKGIKHPWIFPLAGEGYGILAVRVEEDGSRDDAMRGRVLFWTTLDFAEFAEQTPLALSEDAFVEEVQCRYDEGDKTYHILWKDEGGCLRESVSVDLCVAKVQRGQSAESGGEWAAAGEPKGIPGAQAGCRIAIDSRLADRVRGRWSRICQTKLLVPESVCVSGREELEQVGAVAVYSDGSSVEKRVDWDLSGVDFSRPGRYAVTGRVRQPHYPFPLANGYGDPVLMKWEGSWYFIATNDNQGDIGLYMRKSPDISGLFAEGVKEHLVLDVDEERGFVQTFWAPEFHVIGGSLYILFAVGGKQWGPQCWLMRHRDGFDLIDPKGWETPVRVCRQDGSALCAEGITLDMTYVKANRASYMVWSYRRHIGTDRDTGSMLMIASVDEAEPWRLTSDPVLLSRPLFGWENVNGTINNEGPHAFVANNTVYLTYSGGDACGYTYAVGLLTADTDADLLEPSNWSKRSTPVLSYYSVEGEYGPGHNSFFTDEEGMLWIAYHGETALDSRLRCDGMRRVHFDAAGEPVFDMSAERDVNPACSEVKLDVTVR